METSNERFVNDVEITPGFFYFFFFLQISSLRAILLLLLLFFSRYKGIVWGWGEGGGGHSETFHRHRRQLSWNVRWHTSALGEIMGPGRG